MELFGIPVFIIIIIVFAIIADYSQKRQKEKEGTAKKWETITIGMTKDEVIRKLGKPHRVMQVGIQEAWGYGPSDSDGAIMFVDGKITAYQKPS